MEYSKTAVGTRSYMSPERIEGGKYGIKSDVWGIGLIVYELGKFSLTQLLAAFPLTVAPSLISGKISKTKALPDSPNTIQSSSKILSTQP